MTSLGFNNYQQEVELQKIDIILRSFINALKILDDKLRSGSITSKDDWPLQSHNIVCQSLSKSSNAKLLISEFFEEPIPGPDTASDYVVAFNALDGATNLTSHGSVGGIFGIYYLPKIKIESYESDFKTLPIRNFLVCSGYYMFGVCTLLTVGIKKLGVKRFILNPNEGSLKIDSESVQIKAIGKIYSTNQGHSRFWASGQKITAFINSKITCEIPYKVRYSGSFVNDVHQVIMLGGIYICPPLDYAPSGKKRLLYECGPMGLIAEEAGGGASNGNKSILDTTIKESYHQRTPLYFGSKEDLCDLLKFLNNDVVDVT